MNEPGTPGQDTKGNDGGQGRDGRPGMSAGELIERLRGPLSPGRRLRAVAPLLSGLGGGAFLALLWATEPGPLPGRTLWAFGALLVTSLAWAVYGGWALVRRPLYAGEQVVAGWLALAAALLTTGGTAWVAGVRGAGLPVALAIGAVFTAGAVVLIVRAHGRRAALRRRVRELR
ncbi:hypothetical protein ABGB17_07120 [Sphaerisporangium sp. B11E5]|uniref:hypothetical protein n=1 Tax=Sphaerisporangium sp. B11E5 TaxID=3153563 RepID=UPI00325D34DD